jgi:hypothetical protein
MTTRYSLLRALAAGAWLASSLGAATWTDRGEYDLVLLLRAEAVPERRVALLDQWKRKYPKTELAQFRREMYLATFQGMADWPRMLEVAREIAAGPPPNFVGLYWVAVLAPGARNADAAALDSAGKAASQLLSGLASLFDAKAPAGTPKQKAEVELAAHRALGWIAWQRADYEGAEREFTACLQRHPDAAEISAWYGTVLALQKRPEKYVPALWHLARSASVQGDNALSRNQRREIEASLEQMYTAYHGGPDGMNELRAGAAASPFPPNGFNIEPAAVVLARKQEEELNRTNPELAAWLRIRKRLEAPDGETYFNDTLKPAPLPRLKGTLIGSAPPRKPKKLILGLKDGSTGEVELELEAALPREAEPGTVLEFEGSATSFTREPFRVTIHVEKGKLSGWPERD